MPDKARRNPTHAATLKKLRAKGADAQRDANRGRYDLYDQAEVWLEAWIEEHPDQEPAAYLAWQEGRGSVR